MPNTTGYYFPRMRMTAPGAPEQLISDSILRAWATIARETGAFHQNLTPQAFVSGTSNYNFALDGFKINTIRDVWFIEDSTNPSKTDADFIPIPRQSQSFMHTPLLDDRTGARPEWWSWVPLTPSVIAFYPFVINPTLANPAIHVMAEVTPIRLAAQTYNIDPNTAHWGADAFFDINEELTFNLAAGYLLDYPGKTWTNRTQAREFMFKAATAMDELKILSEDDMRSGIPRAVRYGGY